MGPVLGLFGFLLGGLPLSRVMAGPVPIYFLDIAMAAGVMLMWARFIPRASMKMHAHLPALTLIFYLFVFGTWLREMLEINVVIEPLYVLLRYSLGMYLIVLIPSMIRDRRDLDLLLKTLVVGATFSAVFAILYALPQFGAIRAFLNEGSILFPGRARAKTDMLLQAQADRAMSPIGGPNVTGNWFATFWPLALLIWRTNLFGKKWSVFAMGATFVLIAGALMTYGRSTLISLVLVALVIIVFRLYKSWLTTLGIVIGGAAFIIGIGLASSYFDFNLVFFKFERMLEDPSRAHTDTARILSYTTLIPFLEDNPLWMVTGMGMLGKQAVRLGLIDHSGLILNLQQGEVHSMFASAFYKYGVIAMIVLTSLVFMAGLRSAKMGFRKDSPYRYYWQYLFVAFVSIIPYWLFTHIYTTEENGNAFLFMFIGLVMALGKLDPTFRTKRVVRARRYVYAEPTVPPGARPPRPLPPRRPAG